LLTVQEPLQQGWAIPPQAPHEPVTPSQVPPGTWGAQLAPPATQVG